MIIDQLLNNIRQFPNSTLTFLSVNERSYSYSDLAQDVEVLAECLKNQGIGQKSILGIYAQNSYEWIVWDIATLTIGAKLLAIPSETEIDSQTILNYLDEYCLSAIISDRELDAGYLLPVDFTKLTATTQPKFMVRSGIDLPQFASSTEDLTYVFSSGTTGNLKGLVIDKRGTEVSTTRFLEDFSITNRDIHVMYLPFSHFQQRMVIYGCLSRGVSVAFTSYEKALKVIEKYRPTFIISPPAFYESIKFLDNVGAFAEMLPNLCSHIRFAITGMAPISLATLQYFQQKGFPLYEGYGVTEAGFISWNKEGSYKIGSLGKPITKVRLSPEGEILVEEEYRLTRRYFTSKDEKDRKVFLNDGVVATGDLGKFDDEGYLYILGRIKDIIVTAGGKKFNPQEVEGIILSECDVSGAVIMDIAGSVHCLVYSDRALTQEGKSEIVLQIKLCLESLESFKRITKLTFAKKPFVEEGGHRTRTLKLNREAIKKDYVNGNLSLC